MLGHLMEWFYSGVGGIRQIPSSTSYENILIEPEIVGDITWADATYNSIHGEISTSWKIEENIFTLKVKIPVSCHAIIALPQADSNMITENDIPVNEAKDIKVSLPKMEKQCAAYHPGNISLKSTRSNKIRYEQISFNTRRFNNYFQLYILTVDS